MPKRQPILLAVEESSRGEERLKWLLLEGLKCERSAPDRALALVQEALTLSQHHPDRALHAHALRNLAYTHYAQGAHAEALETLADALCAANEAGDTSMLALCHHTQGFFLHHAGRLLEALDAYRRAAETREALGEYSLLAGTLNNLGATYLNLGDYDACLEAHRHALQLWRATDNRFGEAFTLNNIGVVYGVFEDFEAALHYHREAAAVAEHLNTPLLLCEVNTLLARALRRCGRQDQAWHHLAFSRDLALDLTEPRCLAQIDEEEGLLWGAQGEHRKARQALGRALWCFRSVQSQIDITRLLHQIGLLHLAQQRPQRACLTLERCRQRAQAYHLKQLERSACSALADAFEARDDTRAALHFHRQFHRLDRELIDESGERQRLLLLRQIELEKAQRETELQRIRNEELAEAHRRLEEANILLTELATRDGMTGLINHRAFQEQLRSATAHPELGCTALLLIDVDHFKSFNDTFGHPAGDAVLKQVAQLLRQSVREEDAIGRYGGEEFAVLLPRTDLETAQGVAERIRQAVADYRFPERRVTVSIGVATTLQSGDDPTLLLHTADQALYGAKRAGRNQTLLAA